MAIKRRSWHCRRGRGWPPRPSRRRLGPASARCSARSRAGGRWTRALDRRRARAKALALTTAGGFTTVLLLPTALPERVIEVCDAVLKPKERSDDSQPRQDKRDETASTGAPAEIVREYAPSPTRSTASLTTAIGFGPPPDPSDRLRSRERPLVRTLERAGDAGTAFDGTHLYQSPKPASTRSILHRRCGRVDPGAGHGYDSGLAWAEGPVGGAVSRSQDPSDRSGTGAIVRTTSPTASSPA